MFKFTIDIDDVAVPNRAAKNEKNHRSVPVEDAANIEQFPLSEQDINQNTIGESAGAGENG